MSKMVVRDTIISSPQTMNANHENVNHKTLQRVFFIKLRNYLNNYIFLTGY